MRWLRRGQSLVEFALLLPVLLLVFFLIIDGAFIVQGLLTVNHVARQAARFASAYQPVINECYNYEIDGVPQKGDPYCPAGKENDDEYYDRRVRLIKRMARVYTLGLRISTECYTSDCITDNVDVSGLWGVKVWGIHDFDNPVTIEDKPGLQGLPVQVQVVHRVPLVATALFKADASVLVQGTVQMINEGVQTTGDELPEIDPPPDINPDPDDPPPTLTPTPDGGSGPDDPTPELPEYILELNPPTDRNELPGEREHLLTAHVTEDGEPAPGVTVQFSTDNGSFDYSGSEMVQHKNVTTDLGGNARITIYANEPMAARIEAWADGSVSGEHDAGEFDYADKTWWLTGPYLVVSNHNPEAGDVIAVRFHDHDPYENSHTLWWCPELSDPTTVDIAGQVGSGIDVDTNGYYELTSVQVPEEAMGTYYVESHTENGGCGNASDFKARSSDIKIKLPSPDLHISNVEILDPAEELRAPATPMTVAVTVENLQPVPVNMAFDVDVYPDLEEPPYILQMSAEKQWIESLGANASTVLTFVVEIEDVGTNQLWAQVDTTNYIEEDDEENNVFGPLEFEVCPGSDDFDEGVRPIWSAGQVGSGTAGSYSANASGELSVLAEGGSLLRNNDSFFYIYQNYPGDFDARLRTIQVPGTINYAKIGLHVRADMGTDANYAMNMAMYADGSPSSQMAYDDGPNDGAYVEDRHPISLPYWVRIVRNGNNYTFFNSNAERPIDNDDWYNAGTVEINTAMANIGIAQANYQSSATEGIIDDFMICPAEFTMGSRRTIDNYPPGLIECEELLNVRGFEGSTADVLNIWTLGDSSAAWDHTSLETYRGNFSMRLHASLGSYPCTQNNLNPQLSQEIQLPGTVYSISQLIITGHYYVDGSDLECSNPDSPDPNDTLSVELLEMDNNSLVSPVNIINGGVTSQTWHSEVTSMTVTGGFEAYAGNTVRLLWHANHSGDFDGTFFYLDDLSAQMCTMWPIPADEDGTVSFGGKITSQVSGGTIRTPIPGADVWAYTQNGDIYHTTSIHDGTYHFYNLPNPGTYIVYSEALVGGELRTAVANVTLNLGDRDYSINLILQ